MAEIRAFYLLQDIQKQGIGREMFQCFYDYVVQKRYQFIRLEVFNKNPSRFFYEKIGAELIGVNNRNLVTFDVDINTSLELSTHFRDNRIYISESGLFTKQDAQTVSPYFNAILVGTALMQAADPKEKIEELSIDKS